MSQPTIKDLKKVKQQAQKGAKNQAFLSRMSVFFRRKISQSPVKFLAVLGLILGVAITLLVGFFAWQNFIVGERNRQLEKFAEQNARLAAANVADFLHASNKKLEYFTQSSGLVTSLTYKDAVGLLEHKNALRNSFMAASAIRIYPAGDAKLELDADPPVRFAELQQIKKVEKREIVIPEALDTGGGGWRINIVVPVPADELKPVVGSIMVTLPIDELYDSLRNGLESLGKVTLYQSFEGQQRLMGTFGEGTLYKAERISVPNSPWHVEFTASSALLAQTEVDYLVLALIGATSSSAVILFFLFLGLNIGRSIRAKQQAVEDTYRKMGRDSKERRAADNSNMIDVQFNSDDEELLGLADEQGAGELKEVNEPPEEDVFDMEAAVPDHIFRSYDIRGKFEEEVTNNLARKVGQALGSEALENGESSLIVGRDARTHSPILTENLIRGILSAGCDVINIGTVPTPVLYYAIEVLEQTSSAVMVTASHNPAEYNGFKMVMKGKVRSESDVKAVRSRILTQEFRCGIGTEYHEGIDARYIDAIFSDVALAGEISIVIDAGNGVTGKIAPALFSELGCTVIPLYCDLDGTFPNHGPDPSDANNLKDLIAKVRETGADLGVAFDGDGDRLAVVTPKGQIIWPDQLLMMFAKDILARNPGADVVFDVKSSRLLNTIVSNCGGRPIIWKTGHAPMRAKVIETGALLGGEFSGHIFIKDRWYGFDDGMYAAARLIEIISLRDEPLDDVFAELPLLNSTPEIRVPIAEDNKFDLIKRLINEGNFEDAKMITIDGVRAEFPYGWGLVRASNTSAHLTLRFEAETEEQIHSMKALFTREVRKIDPSIDFNWSA